MKITIFVSYTYPYIGSGIGNVALKQAEMLSGLGHDVVVISSNYPPADRVFVKNGVTHLKLPALFWLEKFHVPVPLMFFNLAVLRRIRSSDVIHVHDAVYPSSFFAALWAKIFGKKVVLTQHIAFINYPNPVVNLIQKIAYATLARASFLLSDHIIYFNPDVKKMITGYQKASLLLTLLMVFGLFCWAMYWPTLDRQILPGWCCEGNHCERHDP